MILVTGGAGFIGSNIVAELNARGRHDIAVCDRFEHDERWQNLVHHEIADLVPHDRLDDFLDRHRGRIEAVVHMGAISATTERDLDLIVRTNVTLSTRLWDWCAEQGVRFVYASSAATYGDGVAGFDDDDSPQGLARLRPLNAYGWSKHVFDRMAVRRAASGAATPPVWAGLKYFNVYGPNEAHKGTMKSVVAHIFPKVQAGETVTLFRSHRPDYRDGEQQRDFVYVKDCVDVTLWLLEGQAPNGLYNCGTGQARTFLDLARATFAAANRKPDIAFVDTPDHLRDRYQYYTQANMRRLRAAGYDRPFTSLEDGVADYVRASLAADDPYR